MTEIDKNLFKSETGLGHLVLILVFVVVIGVVGIAGLRVYQNNQVKTADSSAQKTDTKKYDDQRVDNKVLTDLKGTEENEQ